MINSTLLNKNMQEHIKPFLTPEDVAEALQLNVLTVYGYIRNKKLSAVRIGRNYRIDRRDFYEFINSNKV